MALVFVDDSYMRELKGRYLGVRRATDVLAFPLGDDCEHGPRGVPGGAPGRAGRRAPDSGESRAFCACGGRAEPDRLLGEVYIGTGRAIAQARRHRVGLSEEVARLIVHGLLHLFGYSDDTRSSRREMFGRQESFLREHSTLARGLAKLSGRGA